MWLKFSLWCWNLAGKSPLTFTLVLCTLVFSSLITAIWFIVGYFDKQAATTTACILSIYWGYILIQYVSGLKKGKRYV